MAMTRTLLPLLLLTLVACDVPKTPLRDPGGVTPWPDAVDPDGQGGADAAALQACDRRNGDADCPPAMHCETHSQVCVDCISATARCNAYGKRERCPAPDAQFGELLSGGFFVADPCPVKENCVEGASGASCVPRLCEPGAARCGSPTTAQVCDSLGQTWLDSPCSAGFACYDKSCQKIRHNVLLVFDTSDSMNQYIHVPRYPASSCDGSAALPCLGPFPECDDPEDPLTVITRAKKVFADNIKALVDDHVQFALQRFPQYEALHFAGNCNSGWYGVRNVMTGDDDSWETAPGGWFDAARDEVIAVPFAHNNQASNTEELLSWLDFSEGLAASSVACSVHADCPSNLCGEAGGQRRCFWHSDPELRAGGQTPLGKSLFYAGEYFRRFVLVDGKACSTDSDCGSAGYLCKDSQCFDPFSHCRKSFILLFTDGGETYNTALDDFFNPRVQAKRLAFGLGCATDDDCRGGATCDAGVCAGSDGVGLGFVAGGGHDALSAVNGAPISITTSVVNLTSHSVTSNAAIAAAGGGEVLDVAADDPDLPIKVQKLMLPAYKCGAAP